jgi:hypothetical protein
VIYLVSGLSKSNLTLAAANIGCCMGTSTTPRDQMHSRSRKGSVCLSLNHYENHGLPLYVEQELFKSPQKCEEHISSHENRYNMNQKIVSFQAIAYVSIAIDGY